LCMALAHLSGHQETFGCFYAYEYVELWKVFLQFSTTWLSVFLPASCWCAGNNLMTDNEKESCDCFIEVQISLWCVVVVKDKYGDVNLDNVADDSSDSSSSEDEDAAVLCWHVLPQYFTVCLLCTQRLYCHISFISSTTQILHPL